MNADKGSNWFWLIPLGIAYFGIYYVLFRTFIKKFDLKTPGREDDDTQAADDTSAIDSKAPVR